MAAVNEISMILMCCLGFHKHCARQAATARTVVSGRLKRVMLNRTKMEPTEIVPLIPGRETFIADVRSAAVTKPM